MMEELPDEIRVPLHELQADTRALIGRVANDRSTADMIASSIMDKLAELESAIRLHVLGE